MGIDTVGDPHPAGVLHGGQIDASAAAAAGLDFQTVTDRFGLSHELMDCDGLLTDGGHSGCGVARIDQGPVVVPFQEVDLVLLDQHREPVADVREGVCSSDVEELIDLEWAALTAGRMLGRKTVTYGAATDRGSQAGSRSS